MKINGIEGMSRDALKIEVARGGRFVTFSYCISILVMTFRRSSDVFFVRADESAWVKGLPYTLISLVLGWWGFPFGLIFTPWAIFVNLSGGKDMTQEVTAVLLGAGTPPPGPRLTVG